MPKERKRVVEIRLIVLVAVDVSHSEFVDALRADGSPIAASVVASEVSANLQSVHYVETVSVHLL